MEQAVGWSPLAAGSVAGMSSPAESYAAARRRQQDKASALGRFRAGYEFALDEFQVRACQAVEGGRGVLVAAPTGSGKTVVGEFAVHLALEQGRKCFYTTPIKALSNQKYNDLVARHGPARVGLLTGDNTVNAEAPVVVMTTEVLRNMLYAGSSTLAGLGYVVMDEVHYLADRFRGAVWEEVIIHLPASVTRGLTVSHRVQRGGVRRMAVNGARRHRRRGRGAPSGAAVAARHGRFPPARPVRHRWCRLMGSVGSTPSWFATRETSSASLGWATGGRAVAGIGPGAAEGHTRPAGSTCSTGSIGPICCRPSSSCSAAWAAMQRCDSAWTPAFGSRSPRSGTRSAPSSSSAARDIPDEDLHVLGYHEWVDGLERGLAAHHAGMLPTFKEVVEELFVRGLVRAVFATETLALGINMPARSVVLERLVKWNGETHAEVTPGEYTQLTGRAGRRGIDVEGHGIVLWQPGLDPTAVAGLASTRTYPLRSSFRPSYNMAVNLVGQVGRARASELLESSFAQFQADRAVVALARTLRRHEEALDGYREAMTCHLGDFEEYATAAPADLRSRGRAGPAGNGPAQSRRSGGAGAATARRRDSRTVRQVRRPRRGARPRYVHVRTRRWATAYGPDRRLGRYGDSRWSISRPRSSRSPGCAFLGRSTRRRRRRGATLPRHCGPRCRSRPMAADGGAVAVDGRR